VLSCRAFQLTDGGPPPAAEMSEPVVGPPFGAEPGVRLTWA